MAEQHLYKATIEWRRDEGDFSKGRFVWYFGEIDELDGEERMPWKARQGLFTFDEDGVDQLLGAPHRRVR